MSTRITIETNGNHIVALDNINIFNHLVGGSLIHGERVQMSIRKNLLPQLKEIAALHNCHILHKVMIEPRAILWRVSDGRKFIKTDPRHWEMVPEPFEPPMSKTLFTFNQLNDGVSFTSNPEQIGINK